MRRQFLKSIENKRVKQVTSTINKVNLRGCLDSLFFCAMMAIPNLISLLLLSPVLVSETKKYLWDDNLNELDETPIPQINRK